MDDDGLKVVGNKVGFAEGLRVGLIVEGEGVGLVVVPRATRNFLNLP